MKVAKEVVGKVKNVTRQTTRDARKAAIPT